MATNGGCRCHEKHPRKAISFLAGELCEEKISNLKIRSEISSLIAEFRGLYGGDLSDDAISLFLSELEKLSYGKSPIFVESILAAAIKTDDGNVAIALRPGRHPDIIHHLARSGFKTPIAGAQGFITSTGRFVGRVEAKKIAIEAGQLVESEYPQLYSEDLW